MPEETCNNCQGFGFTYHKEGDKVVKEKCETCNGKGKVHYDLPNEKKWK